MSRVILITGSSRGIGAEIGREFAKFGDKVVINFNNNIDLAEKVCKECISLGAKSLAIKADVSDSCQVNSMVGEIESVFGPIDVLINNAGVCLNGLFTDHTEHEISQVFDVNIMGTLNCAKAVIPKMIAQKSGVIINISSMWGEIGASCEVAYSTSKSAVIGFTKALAKELGPSNIRVNCVSPGFIDTEMNSCYDIETIKFVQDETPLMKLGTTSDVAKSVHFLCSDSAKFITGQILGVNGGFVI